MARGGFRRLRHRFLCISLSGHGLAEPARSERRKVGERSAPGNARHGDRLGSPGSRITFIGHAIERACFGHCFSYANYEPASGEFRVRVKKGSPVATSSTDDAEDMASGEYEVGDDDLPMKQIYQCDSNDLTKLCIRDLEAGEVNGRLGYKPALPR